MSSLFCSSWSVLCTTETSASSTRFFCCFLSFVSFSSLFSFLIINLSIVFFIFSVLVSLIVRLRFWSMSCVQGT